MAKKVKRARKPKLSEAILRGCRRTRKQYDEYVSLDGSGCCAIGAALIGSGLANDALENYSIRYDAGVLEAASHRVFPILVAGENMRKKMPHLFTLLHKKLKDSSKDVVDVEQAIFLLNDETNVSRQEIARTLAKDGY